MRIFGSHENGNRTRSRRKLNGGELAPGLPLSISTGPSDVMVGADRGNRIDTMAMGNLKLIAMTKMRIRGKHMALEALADAIRSHLIVPLAQKTPTTGNLTCDPRTGGLVSF
jgi:hypothetical protein